jgi:hypothetical protein
MQPAQPSPAQPSPAQPSPAQPTAAQPSLATSRLSLQAVVMCALLLVQFFVGMLTNLYVAVPAHHPGAHAANYFSGASSSVAWAITRQGSWLAVHTALGLALAITSVLFIVNAFRRHDRVWIWASVLGALFLIGAGFNGASFLVFGKNYSSLLMAGLFALSLASYLAGLFVSGQRQRSSS